MNANAKKLYEVDLQSVDTYTYVVEASDEDEAVVIASDLFCEGDFGMDSDHDFWVEDEDVCEISRESETADEEGSYESAIETA